MISAWKTYERDKDWLNPDMWDSLHFQIVELRTKTLSDKTLYLLYIFEWCRKMENE